MRVSIVLAVLVLSALAGLFSASVVSANCNPGDLFCQGWTPEQQAHKVRVMFLQNRIDHEAREGLSIGTCDAACVDAYDKAGDRLLSRFAKFNDLPVDLVVKAYLVTWDNRATKADALLGRGKWDVQDTGEWFNTFADELRVNHPYYILGERQYCVVADLGGYCPGLW